MICTPNFWRNAYKVYFEREMDEATLKEFLKRLGSEKRLGRKKFELEDNETYERIYNIMGKVADDLLSEKTI